uniref:Calcitonin peptide-like domain-containing protein n=1 Tax=Accipiter nisus TaxID=211598 RepID=A0A8B9M0Z4_9AVES
MAAPSLPPSRSAPGGASPPAGFFCEWDARGAGHDVTAEPGFGAQWRSGPRRAAEAVIGWRARAGAHAGCRGGRYKGEPAGGAWYRGSAATPASSSAPRRAAPRREEIMVMLKISSLLAVYALVVCQMDSFQAAPVRPGLESITDRVTLSDYEARRLLNALVKEFIQMTAEELEQASEGNSLDRPISKRCASLSTCVLGKLSQELHKLQTYPRTDVGAGTPGKKRNVLSDLEHERYANYGEPLGSN